jgi:hypothetical protein
MHDRCQILGLRGLSVPLLLLAASACLAGEPHPAGLTAVRIAEKTKESPMWMTINERRFAITLADNDAARAFAAQLPLTLDMEELNGNEKHARLPTALPGKASRPGTIRNGDLMLYGADTLVVFYSTFNSVYAYTRIGRVDNPSGLAQAVGAQSVRIIFSGQ